MQFDGSTGNLNLHLVTDLLTKQTLSDRSFDGDLTGTEVGFVLADNSIAHRGICGQIGHLHLRQNLYGIGVQTRRIYYLRLRNGGLQTIDLILQMGLSLLGGVVLTILT